MSAGRRSPRLVLVMASMNDPRRERRRSYVSPSILPLLPLLLSQHIGIRIVKSVEYATAILFFTPMV